MARSFAPLREIDVIAPNFKRRLSGVTSTIVQLVPAQRASGMRIAVLGPGLPDSLPRIRFSELWRLWTRPSSKPFRIWHARRNVEMAAGVLLRDVLRMKIRLVFTSAAQRHHKPFTRWLIARMDRVIATSSRSAAYLTVPYELVMHGVDAERFTPPADKRAARAAAGLEPDMRFVGCFGRVRRQKGTDLFVDAMAELLPRHPGWSAIITGRVTGEHAAFAEKLKQKIAKAGLSDRILLLGEVPDILPFYRAIDLYVAPSRNEGFGLTPLEAMACGVPAVTSDAGAYSDMIRPGINGAICPAGDGPALTATIAEMLEKGEALSELAATTLDLVRRDFALESEAHGVNALYTEMFDGKARR